MRARRLENHGSDSRPATDHVLTVVRQFPGLTRGSRFSTGGRVGNGA
jgi:hypothetical protein